MVSAALRPSKRTKMTTVNLGLLFDATLRHPEESLSASIAAKYSPVLSSMVNCSRTSYPSLA